MFDKNKFYINLNKYRRSFQIFTLFFLIAIPILILLDIRYIIGNLYSINFWNLEIVDPSMILQTIVLSKEFYIPLLIGGIIPILLALLLGRVFCSWACPYNTILELLELKWIRRLRRKFTKKNKKVSKNPKPIIYWSIFLVIILITVISGFHFFTWISMPGIISSEIFASIVGFGLGIEFILFIAILLSEVILGKRYWCKYICPVGATLSLFRTKYTLHISHNDDVCDCSAYSEPCVNVCPLNLSPKQFNLYPYCFNCGRCIKICEQTGNRALKFSFVKETLKKM